MLARLRGAGATLVEGAPPPSPAPTGLAFGALPSDSPPGRTSWRSASLAVCALAARDGVLRDPREEAWTPEGPAAALAPAEALRPAPWEPGAERPERRLPLGPPLEGPLRGSVLLRLGDFVTSDQVLPWGARVRPLVGDFAALERVRVRRSRSRLRRAGARLGRWIHRGRRSLRRGHSVRTLAALVLVAAGRPRGAGALSARRISRRLLAQTGVLPLAWSGRDDGRAVRTGTSSRCRACRRRS